MAPKPGGTPNFDRLLDLSWLCWRFGAEEVSSWLDRMSIRRDGSVNVPKAIFCETHADAVAIAEVLNRPVYCEVDKRILRVMPSGKYDDVTDKVKRVASLLSADPRQGDFVKETKK